MAHLTLNVITCISIDNNSLLIFTSQKKLKVGKNL